ncbi:MAG: hypothetical protein ACFFBD_05850 [Candidatus Hodarchaeota archaeon]
MDFLVRGYSYVLAKKGEIFLLVHGVHIYIVKMQNLKVAPSHTLRLPWYGIRSHQKIDRVRLFNIKRIITLPINEVQFGKGSAVGLVARYGVKHPITPDTLLKLIEQVQSKIE